MSVRADSKGRLTGAIPGNRYVKKVDPEGVITFSPEIPREFDAVREVTESQFEEFFGVSPAEVPEHQGILMHRSSKPEPGYLPVGLVVSRFALEEDGTRKIEGGIAVKERTLIRIKRD